MTRRLRYGPSKVSLFKSKIGYLILIKTTTFVASEREPRDYTMKGFYGQYLLIRTVFSAFLKLS
jgi:hypothetical protein